MRIFVVVAKNRPELYQYFTSGFAGVENVEVLLDRRIGPDDPSGSEGEESHRDRRIARDIYEQLEQRGFVIARLPT